MYVACSIFRIIKLPRKSICVGLFCSIPLFSLVNFFYIEFFSKSMCFDRITVKASKKMTFKEIISEKISKLIISNFDISKMLNCKI